MGNVTDIVRPMFGIGEVVHHRRLGYRGVIVDVDPHFQAAEEWYETVALSRPPKNKPWYHVLVDEAVRNHEARQILRVALEFPASPRGLHPLRARKDKGQLI